MDFTPEPTYNQLHCILKKQLRGMAEVRTQQNAGRRLAVASYYAGWARKRHARQVQRIAKDAWPTARSRLRAFRKLSNVSPELPQGLRRRLIHYEAQIALFKAKEDRFFALLSMPPLVIIMILTFFMCHMQ
jgi:hypothetical protein